MNCPVCSESRLREVEKNGVLIDICPSCKGVWLDRGELDKLMQEVREVRNEYNDWYYEEDKQKHHSSHSSAPVYDKDKKYDNNNPRYKKKKSVMDMFGDLFD